jgi:hypothetical protein
MSLVLQSTGGGSVTINEPTTASNFTQTLPAADGTVVISGTTPTLNGITFPATQVPSADANTLDDYEEGTWTPVIVSQTGSLTAYTSSGTYTKVGRTVYINGKFTVTTPGTASGYVSVGAYPFSPNPNFDTQGVAREGASSGDIYFSLLVPSGAGFIIGSSGNSGVNWTASHVYYWNFSYNV